jgi:hypothetical protein
VAKYKMFIIITSIFLVTNCYSQENESAISKLSNVEIDSILTEMSGKNLTVTEKMKFYSTLFLDLPYNLTCTGDGPYALYEPEPLINFQETNCMVYCEHVLALSISDSWDNFFNNLQQIRYQDGMIGMRTRNHYTMGDWLPENYWLLTDVTKQLGESFTKPITRVISHENFFKGKGIDDLRYVKPDREITINIIPFDKLADVKQNFKSGDILSLIFAKLDNIFSAHMLMAYEIEGELYIRESAMSKMTVFDTAYDEWVNKFLDSERYAGISVMRVNDNINQPGKIILPWEISQLKTNP